MYLQFENTDTHDRDFLNTKPNAKEGSRWFVREQDCLLFKDGSTYPDKFQLTLIFADNKQDQQSIPSFAVGKYELTDSAFRFDKNRNPICDFTQLRPLTAKSAIPSKP